MDENQILYEEVTQGVSRVVELENILAEIVDLYETLGLTIGTVEDEDDELAELMDRAAEVLANSGDEEEEGYEPGC